MKIDRKTFIRKTAAAILVTIPVYSLIGCSSSDDDDNENPDPDPNPQGNCLANGTAASIGGNHGHVLAVSKEDVSASTEKTYTIQGTSAHNHSVTITAANFTALASNNSISVTSTNDDGHTHSVTVSCA